MSTESPEEFAHNLERLLGKKPQPRPSDNNAAIDLRKGGDLHGSYHYVESDEASSNGDVFNTPSDTNSSDQDFGIDAKYPQDDTGILDIRASGKDMNLGPQIRAGLQKTDYHGHRVFPSMLLWNEQGLKYFEDVTYTPEYYLTNAEISLLEAHSHEIAKQLAPGAILLELGSGNLRKVGILLNAIDALGTPAEYYALDLDRNELERSLRELGANKYKHVRCHGLLGAYEDGRTWLAMMENAQKPRCVLSLGSTLGSFSRPEAGQFLGEWSCTLQPSEDKQSANHSGVPPYSDDVRIIVGLDACKDGERVFKAYNDKPGANKRFIMNAIEHANYHLCYNAFNPSDWTVQGEWDAENGRHDQYLVPLKDVKFEGTRLPKGELIFLVHSHKYDKAEKDDLWDCAQLNEKHSYMNDDGSYGMYSTPSLCHVRTQRSC